MRSTRRALVVGLALTGLCGGALPAPMAATAKSPATTKNKERKQNRKISTASAQAKQAAAAIPVLAAQLATVNASAVQIVTDLGSPKQLANNVNFLIAAAGALANDVNALKSVDTKHDTQIAQLQKQTILATQLAVGGTNQNSCFGESPPLPSSRNAQMLSLTCLITSGVTVQPIAGGDDRQPGDRAPVDHDIRRKSRHERERADHPLTPSKPGVKSFFATLRSGAAKKDLTPGGA